MPEQKNSTEKQLAYRAFINRENNVRHFRYDEDMKQYELMKAGDPSAVAESERMMRSGMNGRLSDDPVRNVKYLFIACVTITTRFAIEGGMDSETAYNASDLFINKMDLCRDVEEVMAVHHDMFSFFTKWMSTVKKKTVFSKPVVQCMEYIDLHLHLPVRVAELAGHVGLNPSYLSVLFKKETGLPISDYILERRVDTAKNMLRYSAYSASEISAILAFSSQSHFIRCFKKIVGVTPNDYRRYHYRESIRAAQ